MSNAYVDPRSIPASVVQASARDPAESWPGAPPLFGRPAIPHIFTVSGRYGSMGRTYVPSDEALRDSRENAERMRKDCGIMECVEARQRATALLKWHIATEDDKSTEQKQLAQEMTDILQLTPNFLEMRRNLMEAIWYGRYAVASVFKAEQVKGKWRKLVDYWEPRHGDKLVFRYDDGTQEYNPKQVGIRVGTGYSFMPIEIPDFRGQPRRKIEATTQGLAYWLDDYERRTIAIHKHLIEDGPFEDSWAAGRIHGVGIRDRIYWEWYAMVECLQRALEYLDRSALGIEIWRYPMGNPQAEAKTREAAENRIGGGRSIVLVPVAPGEDADLYGVQHIEPGLSGVESVMSVIREYFGHRIKRYILGQTLTSEAEATGLGSGVADAHMATFHDIVMFDAIKLAETITTDILRPLQEWNFPKSRGIRLRFVIDTDSPDMEGRLNAYQQAWSMGAKLKADDVLSIIGASRPDLQDDVLQNPMVAGGMGGGMNGGMNGGGMIPSIGGGANANGSGSANGRGANGSANGTAGANGSANATEAKIHDAFGGNRDRYAAAASNSPTDAQREAGNYKKSHLRLHGLDISIENAKGTFRRPDKPDWPKLAADYGYIRRTEGRDGDHVDVFVGPNRESEIVFIVDQVTEGGRFDEHKCMLGFTNQRDAVQAYRDSYQDGWRVGPVTAMTVAQFKSWLASGDQRQRVEGQVSRYRARDAKFDEAKINRDADGKFAPKGTFAKPAAERRSLTAATKVGKGKDAKIVLADGSDAPPHVQNLAGKIPPAWENVQVSTDPNSDVLATATMVNRKTGKTDAKTVYGSSYEMKTEAIKFARVREAKKFKSLMQAEIEVARNNPATRDAADISMLIMAQATRPGSEGDTKGFAKLYGKQLTAKSVTIERGETTAKGKKKPDKVTLNIDGTKVPIRDEKAVAEIMRRVESGETLHDSTFWLKSYGATTLEARHVVVDGGEVRLEFMGKESVWHRHVVDDPAVAKMLTERKQAAKGDDSQLFGVNETKLNKFIGKLDGEHFTAKDFRTLKATEIGIDEVNRRPTPTNADEYKAATMEVAEVVSRKLGNKPKQALESYIDPTIFHSWRQAAGV